MPTYSIWQPTAGPALASDTSSSELGTEFYVTTSTCTLTGYYFWLATGGYTGARTFKLYTVTTGTTGSLVSGSTFTSGTLTANAWNFVTVSPAVTLTVNQRYRVAMTTASPVGNYYSSTANYFSSGGGAADIVNGSLTCPNATHATGSIQGSFNEPSTAGFPASQFNNSAYYVDVQVTDSGAVAGPPQPSVLLIGPGRLSPAAFPNRPVQGQVAPPPVPPALVPFTPKSDAVPSLARPGFTTPGNPLLPGPPVLPVRPPQPVITPGLQSPMAFRLLGQALPALPAAAGSTTAPAGVAAVTVAAAAPVVAVTATAGVAAVTATAPAAQAAEGVTVAAATVLTAAPAASAAETATAGVATVLTADPGATVTTSGNTNATAGVAAVSVIAPAATVAETATAGAATVLAAAATATAADTATAGVAAAAAAAVAASDAIVVTAGVAVINAAAPQPSVSTSGSTTANAGVAAVAAAAAAPSTAVQLTAGVAIARAAVTAGLAGPAALPGAARVTSLAMAPALTLAANAAAQAALVLAAAPAPTAVPVQPFTVGTLSASDAPLAVLSASDAGGGSGAVLTASDTRLGGPS